MSAFRRCCAPLICGTSLRLGAASTSFLTTISYHMASDNCFASQELSSSKAKSSSWMRQLVVSTQTRIP